MGDPTSEQHPIEPFNAFEQTQCSFAEAIDELIVKRTYDSDIETLLATIAALESQRLQLIDFEVNLLPGDASDEAKRIAIYQTLVWEDDYKTNEKNHEGASASNEINQALMDEEARLDAGYHPRNALNDLEPERVEEGLDFARKQKRHVVACMKRFLLGHDIEVPDEITTYLLQIQLPSGDARLN